MTTERFPDTGLQTGATAPEGPIRILHLEDDPNDVDLVHAALTSEGIEFEAVTVSTRDTFAAFLERGGFDLILSDFSLPTFDGLSALALTRKKSSDLPFILVSGILGEEAAIGSLRGGATDYVLKHRLSRLGPAVRRAMEEAAEKLRRQQLEAQLRQAQKMEAIGRLAGGVAHDFNNLLSVIMGCAEISLAKMASEDPLRRRLEEIRKAAESAASLTRQLLAFSRKQIIAPRVLELNGLISDIGRMLRRLIREDVELVVLQGPEPGRIRADPGQIEQVLMNLVVNARDAMPLGGTLTIETATVSLDEAYARYHPGASAGRYVMLAVTDTGIGMSPEVQSQIFEPFFTTKEAGKGTGLGLATVFGIVKQNDGYIWVDSEPGRGASFKIYLPLVADLVEAVCPVEVAHSLDGTETILIVEDESGIRKVLSESLQSYGYSVLEAGESGQALEIFRRHEGSIHLLMTDVIMPGLGGRDLAERLISLRPELRVLYMSGHTDEAIVSHGVLSPGVAFLQKPFSMYTMVRKVREVLDARHAVVAGRDMPAGSNEVETINR